MQRTTVIRDIPRQKRSNDNEPTKASPMRNHAEGLTGPKKDARGVGEREHVGYRDDPNSIELRNKSKLYTPWAKKIVC